MVFCSECGIENKYEQFCFYCGTKIVHSKTIEKSEVYNNVNILQEKSFIWINFIFSAIVKALLIALIIGCALVGIITGIIGIIGSKISILLSNSFRSELDEDDFDKKLEDIRINNLVGSIELALYKSQEEKKNENKLIEM